MCLCTPCPILRHMSNDRGKEFSLLQEATFVAIWENWEYQARRYLLLCAIDLYISFAVRVSYRDKLLASTRDFNTK